MFAVAELLFVMFVELFTGWVPERPLWLRRVMQVFWGLLVALVLVLAVLGAIYLVEAL